ncbi:MAG: conjugative transposon protein TraM [Prevotellaceae bacterium]|jgi:conjugative transposon TraM protein|nr:conjugative transposon protein TraM [Prevotellaceae bacterium]
MNTNNNQQTDESKTKLSNEQKQKMKKYAVFALMGIICAGCMWFIFAPSANEKAKYEQQMGFNADIPMPKNEGIVADKATAYEQEQMQQKQAERMRSLEDFSSLLGDNNPKQADDLVLLTDEPANAKVSSTPKPASVQNSLNAYRDINRTLGNFYETPKNDTEKEELKRQVEELQAQMNETQNRKNAVDEQMALMEKSFQMASKYLPMNAGTGGAMPANTSEAAANGNSVSTVSGKTVVVPVGQFVEQTVSSLPQEMSDKDIMQAFSKPRNMGFFTATAETSKERKNTIAACVHADQTIMDGESVRLRLLEPMLAGKMLVNENTILSGFTKIQGERLQITVNSLEYNGSIIPVEMSVYDLDGQKGIFIPDTKEINAVKEIAANMGTNAGTSISLSSDAGEQFAADMGRSVIQGVSQFFSKKMREVKVNLKAGYRVFLLPEGNINTRELVSNQ